MFWWLGHDNNHRTIAFLQCFTQNNQMVNLFSHRGQIFFCLQLVFISSWFNTVTIGDENSLMTLCSLSCWLKKDRESWCYTQPFLDCTGRKNYVQFGLKLWVFKKCWNPVYYCFSLWSCLIRQYYCEFLTSTNFNLRGYSNQVV